MGPPSAPSPPGKIYLTPQIEKIGKRRDGLCPSLLLDNHMSAVNSKGGTGTAAMVKSYETNTKYLNEDIRELENDGEELKFITDSIDHFLREVVDERKQSTDLISMRFQPKGCIWNLEMNSSIGAPDYMIQVQCLAKGDTNNNTTFVVDTKLVGKSSKSVASTSLPGFREAKAVFEMASLVVRKAVVKCEFPTFPEGCKGRAFREVYQLNARVSAIQRTWYSLRRSFLFAMVCFLHLLPLHSLVVAAQIGVFCHCVPWNTSCEWKEGSHQMCLTKGSSSNG